jgi:hypothetical protein
MDSGGSRFYRQSAALVGFISLAALGVAGIVPYVIVSVGIDHHGSVVVVVLAVAAVAGVSAYTAWRAPRIGLRETEAGLVAQTPGSFYWLPPDGRAFEEAPPGEYRLRSTGEVVIDPDYLATWTITHGDGQTPRDTGYH